MGRNAHIELGREYAVPGLAEGLIGARGGEERRLTLRFPDDHPDEDLRGKTGVFTVRVSQVAEKSLPSIDDEFAKTVGVADVASLHSAVRSELAHGAFHEARDEAAEKLLQHLLATSSVEVPEVLVQDELDHMVADLRERASQIGITWERFLLQARKSEGEIREEWRPAAERRAKTLLVLDAIAKREGVTVSGAELAQEAAATPIARDPNALRSPAVLAALARTLRNRKLLDKLLGIDSADAEAELIRRAGGPETPGAEAPPELVVPQHGDATPEGREAIRSLLK
jgi:trigger factor